MRPDDARNILEQELNAAFMAGELRVKVLHGIGAGVLRRLTGAVVAELGFGRVLTERVTVSDGETYVDLHPPEQHVLHALRADSRQEHRS